MPIGLATLISGAQAVKKGWDWWQNNKNDQSGIAGKFARTAGNFLQKNVINNMDDGFLKYAAEAVNKTVFSPTQKKSSDVKTNKPPVEKSESFNSSNAVYSSGEGSLYGNKPGARNPYDYASTDFEGILRKQFNGFTPKRAKPYRMR